MVDIIVLRDSCEGEAIGCGQSTCPYLGLYMDLSACLLIYPSIKRSVSTRPSVCQSYVYILVP